MSADEDRKWRKLPEDQVHYLYVNEGLNKIVKRRQEVKVRIEKLTDEEMTVATQSFDVINGKFKPDRYQKKVASIYQKCAGSIRKSRPAC